MNVGFIGLGIMGRPMAKNILKAGFPVTVYSTTVANVEGLVKSGASAAGTPAEVAARSDVIIIMVPDAPQIIDVCFNKNGIVHSKKKSIVVAMSSISPEQAIDIGDRLAEHGFTLLDAPVSGGEQGAVDGTLSIMVGGYEKDLESVMGVLNAMGTTITHCGKLGAGNITKLANQMIVAANIMVAGEAFVFAKKAGVEPDKVFNAIRGGLAGSKVMDTKLPVMMSGNFAPGGKLKFQKKDALNVMNTAQKAGAHIPLSSMVTEIIKWHCANGMEENDHSIMVKYFEMLNGVDIRKK